MSTLLDEETIVLDALDFDVPCRKVGDHGADVAFTCLGCAHIEFACRVHLDELRDYIALNAVRGIRTVHKRCGHLAWTLDELARVVTL